MLWPKKNSYKEFDNEKKFQRLENSPTHPPPNNFSNGPSLRRRDGGNNGFLVVASVPLFPPPSRVVSRPNSLPLPFRTPATQAKEKHKIKQINTFGTL